MATGRIGVTPTFGVRWSKAPAGGTTSLSGNDDNSVPLAYSVGYENVYRNGVLLSRGNDYTATNGTTITLVDATIAGDIIEVFANVAIPLTDTYSKAAADAKFINNTLVDAKGDIVTATGNDTPAKLTVGSNNQVLMADSAQSTGLKYANEATATLTTTGDTLYASAANTLARLGVGSSGQVLTVSGGVPTWATPSSGAFTSLASGSLSGSSVSLTSISNAYRDLVIILKDVTISSTGEQVVLRFNSDTTTNYGFLFVPNGSVSWTQNTDTQIQNILNDTGTADSTAVVRIYDYADTTAIKLGQGMNHKDNAVTSPGITFFSYHSTSAISSVQINVNGGTRTFTAGTYVLYGVK